MLTSGLKPERQHSIPVLGTKPSAKAEGFFVWKHDKGFGYTPRRSSLNPAAIN
jgi:hypothetical protein